MTEKPMEEEQITIDQHFVPQCYLKEFANSDGKISVYNKQGQLLKKRYFPKSISFQKLLYELNLDDPDNKIEKFFSNIENKYAVLSNKLLSLENVEDFDLTQDEQIILLLFILRLSLGNPSQYDNLNNEDFNKLWKRELEAHDLSKEDKIKSLEKLEEHNRKQLPIAIRVAFHPKFLVEFMIRKKFIFILTKEDSVFLTSDNPIIEWCDKGTGLFESAKLTDTNYGVALSPYVYLKIVDKDIDKYVTIKNLSICHDKNGELSYKHNELMFKQCIKFVYGYT